MKYFTQKWCDSHLNDFEIENILKKYQSYIDHIFPQLPFPLKLIAKNLNLHDGLIYKISFSEKNHKLILNGIFGDLQMGYFNLELKYFDVRSIDQKFLESTLSNQKLEILSDELEVYSDEKMYSHKLFFSINKEINIIFSRIEIKILEASPKKYKKKICKLYLY